MAQTQLKLFEAVKQLPEGWRYDFNEQALREVSEIPPFGDVIRYSITFRGMRASR